LWALPLTQPPTRMTCFLASGVLHSAAPTTVWIVVLSFVFLECAFIIGLFLPGDSLLFAAGVVLAAHEQEVSAWALAFAAPVAAVVGNHVGFLVGRRTGVRILARKDGRILNRVNLDRAAAFFERWGFWSVVVARWLPWVRTLAPMIAGAAGMDNRRYILANSLGRVTWVPILLPARVLRRRSAGHDALGQAGHHNRLHRVLHRGHRIRPVPLPPRDAPPRRRRPHPRRVPLTPGPLPPSRGSQHTESGLSAHLSRGSQHT